MHLWSAADAKDVRTAAATPSLKKAYEVFALALYVRRHEALAELVPAVGFAFGPAAKMSVVGYCWPGSYEGDVPATFLLKRHPCTAHASLYMSAARTWSSE